MGRLFLCLLVAFLFSVNGAFAGNVDTYGIGAKATALGGAFAAYADDPFAIYYNPAGITQIERPVVSLGTHLIKPSMYVYGYQVTGVMVPPAAGPQDFQDHSSTLVVPHAGFVMPVSKTVTAGIALYVPYGLDVKWGGTPSDVGSYNAYHSWYRREVVTPTVAYRLTDTLSVGVGLSLGKSKAGVERLAFAPFISGLHNRQIETDMSDEMNYSLNVGFLYKPTKKLAAGLTYRGRTSTKFEGTTRAVGLSEGDTVVLNVPGGPFTGTVHNTVVNAQTEIDHPEQLQLGIRCLPVERLSFEVDVVWTRWSRIDGYTVTFDKKFLDVTGFPVGNPGKMSEYFPRDWKDTTQVRFGVEWQVNKILALRGSYFYDPSPIPDTTMDLQWADADKRTFALGMGLNFGRVTVDGVLQYTVTDGKRDIAGESGNLNGSYAGGGGNPAVSLTADGHLWGGGVTVSYSF